MASVARYCCCDVGCKPEYEVTVTGIDGNICCVNNETATTTAFDGVFTVPFSLNLSLDECLYVYTYTASVTFTSYSDACVTPSGPTRTKTVEVILIYNLTTSKITTVQITDDTGGQDIFFEAVGSWDLGDTINNTSVCGKVGTRTDWCDVGSVVVNLP